MLLIPAIDLKDGHCVRLRQGDMNNNVTVFSEDPVAMARHWLEQGARRLHIVDLNAARSGRPVNEGVIRRSSRRSVTTCRFSWAVASATSTRSSAISTTASARRDRHGGREEPGFLHDACSAFAGHVIVALDAKAGKVATDGWSKLTGHDVNDLAKKFEDLRCRGDPLHRHRPRRHVDRREHRGDGRAGRHVKIPVIASGGVASMDDIESLCAVEADGVTGAILGRSLYEGTLDFKRAQERADALAA